MATSDLLTDCCTTPATEAEEQGTPAIPESFSTGPGGRADTEALDELRSETTTPEAAAVRSAAFRLLLDHPGPLTASQLAAATGLDTATIAAAVAPGSGRVELDDAGRIVGIAGLTINPTRHQLIVGDETRWTWCALDAVGILGALEATGGIRSTDPGTGDAVEIDFVEGRPQGDAALFILGGYDGANLREEWCPLVNFFVTRREAEAWATANELHRDIVSVVQIAEEAAAIWRPLTDPTPRPGASSSPA